jgi:hypothetical protein
VAERASAPSKGGSSNYLGGLTAVRWHVRRVFEAAAAAAMDEVYIDGVLRYASPGGGHENKAAPGFDRMRLRPLRRSLAARGISTTSKISWSLSRVC